MSSTLLGDRTDAWSVSVGRGRKATVGLGVGRTRPGHPGLMTGAHGGAGRGAQNSAGGAGRGAQPCAPVRPGPHCLQLGRSDRNLHRFVPRVGDMIGLSTNPNF